MNFKDKFKSDNQTALQKKCIENRGLEKKKGEGLEKTRGWRESGKTEGQKPKLYL